MNLTFGLSVTIVNVIIIIVLASGYIYHHRRLKKLQFEETDVDFGELEIKYKSGNTSFKNAIRYAIYVVLSKLAVKFHLWIFYVNGFLLSANLIAFITGIFGYFIYKLDTPDLLLFGRVSDRYLMLMAYLGVSFLGRSIFTQVHLLKPDSK